MDTRPTDSDAPRADKTAQRRAVLQKRLVSRDDAEKKMKQESALQLRLSHPSIATLVKKLALSDEAKDELIESLHLGPAAAKEARDALDGKIGSAGVYRIVGETVYAKLLAEATGAFSVARLPTALMPTAILNKVIFDKVYREKTDNPVRYFDRVVGSYLSNLKHAFKTAYGLELSEMSSAYLVKSRAVQGKAPTGGIYAIWEEIRGLRAEAGLPQGYEQRLGEPRSHTDDMSEIVRADAEQAKYFPTQMLDLASIAIATTLADGDREQSAVEWLREVHRTYLGGTGNRVTGIARYYREAEAQLKGLKYARDLGFPLHKKTELRQAFAGATIAQMESAWTVGDKEEIAAVDANRKLWSPLPDDIMKAYAAMVEARGGSSFADTEIGMPVMNPTSQAGYPFYPSRKGEVEESMYMAATMMLEWFFAPAQKKATDNNLLKAFLDEYPEAHFATCKNKNEATGFTKPDRLIKMPEAVSDLLVRLFCEMSGALKLTPSIFQRLKYSMRLATFGQFKPQIMVLAALCGYCNRNDVETQMNPDKSNPEAGYPARPLSYSDNGYATFVMEIDDAYEFLEQHDSLPYDPFGNTISIDEFRTMKTGGTFQYMYYERETMEPRVKTVLLKRGEVLMSVSYDGSGFEATVQEHAVNTLAEALVRTAILAGRKVDNHWRKVLRTILVAQFRAGLLLPGSKSSVHLHSNKSGVYVTFKLNDVQQITFHLFNLVDEDWPFKGPLAYRDLLQSTGSVIKIEAAFVMPPGNLAFGEPRQRKERGPDPGPALVLPPTLEELGDLALFTARADMLGYDWQFMETEDGQLDVIAVPSENVMLKFPFTKHRLPPSRYNSKGLPESGYAPSEMTFVKSVALLVAGGASTRHAVFLATAVRQSVRTFDSAKLLNTLAPVAQDGGRRLAKGGLNSIAESLTDEDIDEQLILNALSWAEELADKTVDEIIGFFLSIHWDLTHGRLWEGYYIPDDHIPVVTERSFSSGSLDRNADRQLGNVPADNRYNRAKKAIAKMIRPVIKFQNGRWNFPTFPLTPKIVEDLEANFGINARQFKSIYNDAFKHTMDNALDPKTRETHELTFGAMPLRLVRWPAGTLNKSSQAPPLPYKLLYMVKGAVGAGKQWFFSDPIAIDPVNLGTAIKLTTRRQGQFAGPKTWRKAGTYVFKSVTGSNYVVGVYVTPAGVKLQNAKVAIYSSLARKVGLTPRAKSDTTIITFMREKITSNAFLRKVPNDFGTVFPIMLGKFGVGIARNGPDSKVNRLMKEAGVAEGLSGKELAAARQEAFDRNTDLAKDAVVRESDTEGIGINIPLERVTGAYNIKISPGVQPIFQDKSFPKLETLKFEDERFLTSSARADWALDDYQYPTQGETVKKIEYPIML